MTVMQMFNPDELYATMPGNKVLINDMSSNDIETLTNLLRAKYNSDVIKNVARCSCEAETNNYLIGHTCKKCGLKVEEERKVFLPQLWCKKLTDVGFINPNMWLMIASKLGKINKYDSLRYLSDATYNPPGVKKFLVEMVEDPLFERSYAHLVNNFGDILYQLSIVADKNSREALAMLYQIYLENEEIMISNYLPILTKKLFVTEEGVGGKGVVSANQGQALDVAMTFLQACNSTYITETELESVMGATISNLCKMVMTHYQKSMSGKYGGARKYIHASEASFAARCIGSSLSGPHKIDSIEIPWGIAMVLFRPHLMNLMLTKYKLPYKIAEDLLKDNFSKYHPFLNKLFKEIIANSPTGRYPVVLNRPPILLQSSILNMFISSVRTDPNITTFGLSPLVVVFLLGDFDGDEYALALLLSNKMSRGMKTLALSSSVFSTDEVGAVGKNITLSKSGSVVMANAIKHASDTAEKGFNNIFSDEGVS